MKTHVYTKNTYMNVHGNVIRNSQKAEQAKCSTEQMWYIHTLEYY